MRPSEKVTFRLDEESREIVQELVEEGRYKSRAAFVCEAIRSLLREAEQGTPRGDVGTEGRGSAPRITVRVTKWMLEEVDELVPDLYDFQSCAIRAAVRNHLREHYPERLEARTGSITSGDWGVKA